MKSLSLHEGEKEEELQLSGRLVFQGGMIKKKKKPTPKDPISTQLSSPSSIGSEVKL